MPDDILACAQGYEGAKCKLAVTLDLTWVSLDAKGILQAGLQLGARGIVTRVSIVSVPAGLDSNGSWMEMLAPILHKLELDPVAALSASIVGQRPSSRGNYVSLDPSHWQQINQSLHTLCVREYPDQLYFWYKIPVLPHVLRCIAQFGSLRKLHLTLEMSLITYVCFEQLAKLNQLRHLALQCRQWGISCANVILSNQATLRSITLASCCWSLDTYAALNKASALMVLSVRVATMTESDARILGNLKTPQSLRLELQDCGQMGWRAMEALSSGQAKITFVSLWRMPPDQGLSYWTHLMPMPCLTTLVMGNSMDFNGRSVQKQPSVSTLYLVDCNDITEQGVANIVDMFPGLNTVLLCKEARYRTEPHDSRTVAQQLMFLNYHSGLPADSTSTNELSVQLATVVGRSSGLQVMSNVQTISSRRNT